MLKQGWYFECVRCLVRGRVYGDSEADVAKESHRGCGGEVRITGPIREGAHGHSDDGRVAKVVRLDPDLAARLDAAAAERDVSQAWIVRHAIVDFLDRLVPGPFTLTRETSHVDR